MVVRRLCNSVSILASVSLGPIAIAAETSQPNFSVYFYPNPDSHAGPKIVINHSELKERLEDLIDKQDKILNVWIYTYHLHWWSLLGLIYGSLHFCVLESEQFYWSIEKISQGITLQRSVLENPVKNQLLGRRRYHIKEICRNIGHSHRTLGDLINYLYEKNQLNMGYKCDAAEFNCKGKNIQ